MDNAVTLISTLGFPIVACIALAFYIFKQNDKQMERMNKQDEKIDSLNEKLFTIIEDNTRALNNINDVIEKLKV